MHTQTAVEHLTRYVSGQSSPPERSILPASHLPQWSVRQIHSVLLAGNASPSILESEAHSDNHRSFGDNHPRVNVAAGPSDQNCRHQVFIEYGTLLKKLDLPSTDCVEVSQRFEAHAGDVLSFEHVILLRSGHGFGTASSAVRAILVNLQTQSIDTLLDRAVDGCGSACPRRIASNSRETVLFTLPAPGNYELRFVTAVDPNNPGSEAHLLVDAVRVVDPSGIEVTRLASVGCVGRVRRRLSD
jgi:hypothetical protein